ncbi:hypothetical protein [Nocardiopsis sp. NRRL B-16309]|uniref:hypothetical protein n=1 Tax=Nocardiopsis sp. NRRL B-16309 TaxID=1519494 RepID=UPI0006B026CD|nr:hypothetical protein [Nocardiopsis sp. NRRL B-16309]KOX15514.1 hypothetical protein ADL05_15130 [Nocardiopsis sp. NRRL B-16309]
MDGPPWTWSGPFRIGSEVAFDVRECGFGWRAAYDQADTHVVVRIQLAPDAGIAASTMDNLRTAWRDGIIGKWSDRFDCTGNGQRKRITFDVQWVNSGAHHVVRVRTGPERSNVTTWDTSDTGDVASHEFGHMLGHPDEYVTAACPSRTPVNTGTVMDDNSETVARLYDRITALHCGHTPAAAPGEGPGAGEGEGGEVRSIDRLEPSERAESLGRLRGIGARAGVADPDRNEVSFEVSGGAPGERYVYRVAVTGSGAVHRHLLDDFSDEPESEATGRVDQDTAARVFAAAERVGLLDDEPPEHSAGDLPPDSLVAVVTVRDGAAVRWVTVPAADTEQSAADLPGEAADVPMETSIRLPRENLTVLRPVLDALHDVEASL